MHAAWPHASPFRSSMRHSRSRIVTQLAISISLRWRASTGCCSRVRACISYGEAMLSHCITKPKSSKCPRVHLFSVGTPVENSPQELLTLLAFLMPRLFAAKACTVAFLRLPSGPALIQVARILLLPPSLPSALFTPLAPNCQRGFPAALAPIPSLYFCLPSYPPSDFYRESSHFLPSGEQPISCKAIQDSRCKRSGLRASRQAGTI